MTCENYKELMMAYLDGEIYDDQKAVFEAHLKECSCCSKEIEEFRKLNEITGSVEFAEPEDEVWDGYWENVYNRSERFAGWILFSIAGILLVIYGGFKLIECIIKDNSISLLLKCGFLALLAGLAVLFISVLRERLYFRKKDRYDKVRR